MYLADLVDSVSSEFNRLFVFYVLANPQWTKIFSGLVLYIPTLKKISVVCLKCVSFICKCFLELFCSDQCL